MNNVFSSWKDDITYSTRKSKNAQRRLQDNDWISVIKPAVNDSQWLQLSTNFPVLFFSLHKPSMTLLMRVGCELKLPPTS